jgi:hypothetical protein
MEEIFPYSTAPRPVLGSIQPPIKWVPRVLTPEIKRVEYEADHSPPSNAEIKSGGDILHSPACLHGIVLN